MVVTGRGFLGAGDNILACNFSMKPIVYVCSAFQYMALNSLVHQIQTGSNDEPREFLGVYMRDSRMMISQNC